MQAKVEICGVNTAQLTVLKGSEMRKLLELAHNGDSNAREKLISGNLRRISSDGLPETPLLEENA